LGFKGGKGIAPAPGVWIGSTIRKITLAGLAGILLGIAFTSIPGWSLVPGHITTLATLLI